MHRFIRSWKYSCCLLFGLILIFSRGDVAGAENTHLASIDPLNTSASVGIDRNEPMVQDPEALVVLPPPGCTAGETFDTCAFYISSNTDDAGIYPDSCGYTPYLNEVYFGECFSGESIISGLRFPNVALESAQDILSSYIEFTIDGPYLDGTITVPIYGEANPNPAPFGSDVADLTSRPTVLPVVDWMIPCGYSPYNLADPWYVNGTRRTADITPILEAVMGQPGWQNGMPVAFLFKNMESTDPDFKHRRVMGFERSPSTYTGSVARLVVRQGHIPRNSLSFYWVSATRTGKRINFKTDKLRAFGVYEANKNQPLFVILDFGAPFYTSKKVGTTLISTDLQPTTAEIEQAVIEYITGFMSRVPYNPQAKLLLGVGTNNAGDVLCSRTIATNHGTAWAQMINNLNGWLNIQPGYSEKISIWGASDFESWSGEGLTCGTQVVDPAPAINALDWARAFNATTTLPLIDFGIMDSTTIGLGDDNWGVETYWQLAWGLPNNYPLPQIYMPNGSNAASWHDLARMSAICTNCLPADPTWTKPRQMIFLGTLTEYGSTHCAGSNSPSEGWKQLYRQITADVYTDTDPFLYSTDISFDTSIYKADWCPNPAPPFE